jgi:Ran GTPase-activating protein (RanGAP) involved in mRNA processing and transport
VAIKAEDYSDIQLMKEVKSVSIAIDELLKEKINLEVSTSPIIVDYASKISDFKKLIEPLFSVNETVKSFKGKLDQLLNLKDLDIQSLIYLNLENNSIGDKGAISLSQQLHKLNNLRELYLGNNSIGDKGAIALSNQLDKLPNLNELRLSNNSIQAEGAMSLSNQLDKLPNLNELRLSSNSIKDKGAIALSRQLDKLSNLIELHIGGNSIGDEGAKALSEKFDQLPNLKVLYLDVNQIGLPMQLKIKEQLKGSNCNIIF